jgi:hypothetical protein
VLRAALVSYNQAREKPASLLRVSAANIVGTQLSYQASYKNNRGPNHSYMAEQMTVGKAE